MYKRQTEEQARRLLEEKNLVASVTSVDSDRPAGEVLSQSVEAETEVDEQTVISLEVSNGQQALKDREITVTFPQNPETIEPVSYTHLLVTLPVEFNASARALRAIDASGLLTGEELSGTRKVLSAAAMTYVAALITSLAQLLRLVLLFGGGRRCV